VFYNNLVPKTSHFWDIQLKNAMTLKTGLGVRQGHWKCHHSIECIWLPVNVPQQPWAYLPFPRYTAISVENRKIFQPRVFFAPAERVPLGIWYWCCGSKTRMMRLPGRQRSLTISSAVWIECTNVTDRQTDGRTDGQTDTGRLQRPRLRIESRGKNDRNLMYTVF